MEAGAKMAESSSADPPKRPSHGPSTASICKRCSNTFNKASNSESSCRFHPSFFVCRRHDDQKRYYELGPDDPPYEAKFYDCCGAEDVEAPGCTTSFHVSYDEE